MRSVRLRVLSIRAAAFAGLAASAALAADALRPERPFCPVEVACAAARSSALGSVLGVPTSVLGIVAFGGLLALTLFSLERARPWLRLAGFVAAAAGAVLLAFQAFALRSFCPLCLVADVSGLAAGAALVGWKGAAGEPAAGVAPVSTRGRLAWGGAAALLAATILLWPTAARPSWVPLDRPASPASEASVGAATPRGIAVVEYLNPFCPHCRATHARLARVLDAVRVPVDRTRLYVWGGDRVPLWAKACVCAQDQGRERPFFAQLLLARDEGSSEIGAAARRAGLDAKALAACAGSGGADERLALVHRRVLDARIEGLPTLDIGRRRLEGEQTEAELREAVAAAIADLARGAER